MNEMNPSSRRINDEAKCKSCNGEGRDRDGYDMLTGASCRACRGSGLDQSFMTEEESELPAEEWAGIVPGATGNKFDSEKPRMDLIPPYMEEEVAMVLAFGAQKYDAENWRKVNDLRSRYLAAAQRHINALKKGNRWTLKAAFTMRPTRFAA